MQILPRYVVFGEALTDFIREGPHYWRSAAGGSCWNVARVCARLGLPTGFAGAVSRDVFGDEIARLSDEAGLDARFLQRIDKSPFLAMVASKDPPQYFFIGDDSADLHFDPVELPEYWLDAVEIVHFGSISLVREPLAGRLLRMAEAVHAAGKRIAFDPNHRNLMGADYLPILERMARIADYIKVSDEDLSALFPAVDAREALAQLRHWAPLASIMFTCGASGLSLMTPEREVLQPAFSVNMADTVGCGDASMGGWMYSVLTRPDVLLEAHASFAAATAAVACRHHGAYAPTSGEVQALDQ